MSSNNQAPMRQSNANVVIALLFAVAALAQCGKHSVHVAFEPCAELCPVTIGGSMVVGCR